MILLPRELFRIWYKSAMKFPVVFFIMMEKLEMATKIFPILLSY